MFISISQPYRGVSFAVNPGIFWHEHAIIQSLTPFMELDLIIYVVGFLEVTQQPIKLQQFLYVNKALPVAGFDQLLVSSVNIFSLGECKLSIFAAIFVHSFSTTNRQPSFTGRYHMVYLIDFRSSIRATLLIFHLLMQAVPCPRLHRLIFVFCFFCGICLFTLWFWKYSVLLPR